VTKTCALIAGEGFTLCVYLATVCGDTGHPKERPVEVAVVDCASSPRSSVLRLRRSRSRSFTGPISVHHDGPRGTRSTSAAFKGRLTRADTYRWCTTPGRLARDARGAVHLSQVWVRKLRNRGTVQPEPPWLVHHRGIFPREALLTVVHDPRSPCEDKHWGPYTPSSWSNRPGDAF
jgi:hypothetical protein